MKTATVAVYDPAASARELERSRALGRLALAPAERAAVAGMVAGETGEVVVHVQDRATAFASGASDVRRRALARAAAVHEAQAQELAALLAAAVVRRDFDAAHVLDRTLTSATARYRSMLEQLRLESVPTRRLTVLAKGTVAVSAEESP